MTFTDFITTALSVLFTRALFSIYKESKELQQRITVQRKKEEFEVRQRGCDWTGATAKQET